MGERDSFGNGLPHPPAEGGGKQKSGRIIRIGTAFGTFVVEIVNDFGPVADALAGDIESCVIECLRAHRHIGHELATVDVQRGDLDFESFNL